MRSSRTLLAVAPTESDALSGEVADQDAHDAEVQLEDRGDLDDRVRLLAELDDGDELGRGADGQRVAFGDDDRLERQIGGAAACDRR